MSVSFITTLKPFKREAHWDWHQESALFSWSLLKNTEVIVVGVDDEEGLVSAQKYGCTVIPEVSRAFDIGYSSMAPVLTEVLRKGIEAASNDWIVLINSDIILMPEAEEKFNDLLFKIEAEKNPQSFMTVRRRNFEMPRPIIKREQLEELRQAPSFVHPAEGSDIFISSREFWLKSLETMPDFIMGRFSWDNYFHYLALEKSSKAVEATETIYGYHPHHSREATDPTHPELAYNLQLYHASVGRKLYTLDGDRWLRV